MTLQYPAHIRPPAITLDADFSYLEEGARYALLQRLAPALQHHMMGKFQSVDMIAAMMERRLRYADPDLSSLREDSAALGNASRTAVKSIMDLMTWIEPKTASPLRFDAGVKECLGLLSTEFRFKGFVIVNEVPEIDMKLSSRALRSVLSATLIAMSDLSTLPATLVVRAQAMPGSVALSIDLHPNGRDMKNAYATDSRLLTWRDAEVLAIAESVTLTRGDTGAQLAFSLPLADADLPDDLVIGARI